MGKYDGGILGDFNGKVGAVIGTRWRGIKVMKSKGPSKRKNNSQAQVEQQAKFKLAVAFVKRMRNLFKITFKLYAQQKTARNNAVAGTVKEAVTGIYPNYAIDYSKVLISKGGLEDETNPTITITAGVINWQWNFNGDQNGANGKDKTIVVAFCPFHNHGLYQVYGPLRETNAATLNVTPFMGQTVHTWLAFIKEDSSEISDSTYTGQIVVA
jgi:Family of unknown function (DUF6266)